MRRALTFLLLLSLSACVHAQVIEHLGGTSGAGGVMGLQSNVQPQLQLNTAICPSGICAGGTLGLLYSLTIPVVNGIQPYGCSLNSGTLPNGTSVTTSGSTCVVSGTISPNAGSFTFVLKAVDSASTPNQAFSGNLTVVVGCPALLPDPQSILPPAQQGVAYSSTFQGQGGIAPISCSSTGTLPTGETLGGTGNCTLAGTPSLAGSFTFPITFTDSCNLGGQTVTATYSEQVNTNLAITTTSLSSGTVGQPYAQTLSVAGGTGPYLWTVFAGTLPSGITLSATTGGLSGTPTTPGTSTFTVKVTDSLSNSATAILSISVSCQQLSFVSTSPICGGTQTQPYSCQMQAAGGFGSLSWTAPGLGACGLAISNTGLISGTASCFGTFAPTISVADSCPVPQSISGVFDIPIAAAAPPTIVTTSPLPNATVGTVYGPVQMQATGGITPYSWSEFGPLPSGITLSANGTLSGTPTSSGGFSPQVTVADSRNITASATFSLTSTCTALSFPAPTLPQGTQNQAFSFTFVATGGAAPVTFTETGTLPAGLTLSSAGVLSGTPTNTGIFNFTVTAKDACLPTPQTQQQAVSLTIAANSGALTISSTSPLPGATEGVLYSNSLIAIGGTPPYTWAVSAGSTPAGTSLSSAGVVSGTPTTTGTSSFTARVTDNIAGTTTKAFNLSVSCVALAITSPSTLPGGTQTHAYSFQFQKSGGTGAVTWGATGVPAGLTLSSAGLLSGTPTVVGTFTINVTATDACSPTPQTASGSFSLTIVAPIAPLQISTANPLQSPTCGVAFSQQMAASGGVPPYTFALTGGAFPAGITMPPGAGVIQGTATQAVTTAPQISVTDTQPVTTTVTFSMTSVCAALNITTGSLPPGRQGTAYSAQINAAGGFSTLSYSALGLPTGLSINSVTGAISGTPSVSGTFAVAVTVADLCSPTAQTTTANYSLVVNTNLAITTGSLPNGTVSTLYGASVNAAGGTQPYSFAVTSGTLPTSVSLSGAGVLSGTPTVAGTYSFTITVTDNIANTASQAYTVTIAPALPPPPGAVALPQNWVANPTNASNTSDCYAAVFGTPNQTFTFPNAWTGGGAYTNNAAGLRQAVADAETYRNAHQSAGSIRIIVSHGSLFAITGSSTQILLPQTTGDASTNCIALVTDGTLAAGQTVCAHGIQDANAEATDPGTRNATCSNDAPQMWTLESQAGGVRPIISGPPDANGNGPHHYAIVGAEVREQAGLSAAQTQLVMIGNINFQDTTVASLPNHIYFDRDWLHGDRTDAFAGVNQIQHAMTLDCNNCAVTNSQFSQLILPGTETQAINMINAQRIKIVHNWIEGTSENVFCGGAATFLPSPQQSCTDLEIRRNRLTYPAAWLGTNIWPTTTQSTVRKNCFEMKSANRILSDGNICENVDDSGSQMRPFGLNPKAYNSTIPQYSVGVQNVTWTDQVMRNLCNSGAWFASRSAPSPNGQGVSMPLQLLNVSNNLLYNASRPSFCSTADNAGGFGMQFDASDTQFTGCTAQRDSAGKNATITCVNTGTGHAQTDTNVGDPITVTACVDATFNAGLTTVGPFALAGTNPNGLTIVYANPGTANATTTGCAFDNFKGFPNQSTFAHNTIISATSGFGMYASLAHGKSGGFTFQMNNVVRDNLLTAGGIQGQGLSDSSSPTAQASNWDLSTAIFRNNVYTARSCSGYVDVLTLGGAQIKPPTTSFCPTTAFCTTTDPTAGSCVGISGAMSTSALNVNLSDWNSYGLCHNGTAGCAKASLYAIGQLRQASDGTDRGASMTAIGTGETQTTYVCSTSCGSGPFPD